MYDMKYLMRFCENLHGGLNKIADAMGVSRVGAEHQAGSDSLLTSAAFFRMRELFFSGGRQQPAGKAKDEGPRAPDAPAAAAGADGRAAGHPSISMHGLDDHHEMRFLRQHMGIITGLNDNDDAGAGADADVDADAGAPDGGGAGAHVSKSKK